MDNKESINLGSLPKLLPDISFNTERDHVTFSSYYKISFSIFKYLCKHRRQNGSILDPNISSTLDAQYHHANFSLAAIILYVVNKDESYCDKAYKTSKYYIDVQVENKKGAIDFSNFPILVSYLFLRNIDTQHPLKVLLKDYIENMIHHATLEEGHTYGNNFITLRSLNHLLRYKIFNQAEDLKSAKYFIDCTLKWQFEDGIFYDYPREFNYKKGIPSLAYHSKITLITLLFGLIGKEEHVLNKAYDALKALEKLTASDGEAFYYGRTNNALYGYACAILAFRIASNLTREAPLSQKYKKCENALFDFCSQHKADDGHLYIVPNNMEDERCGFDNYMYVTVYNAFTMSMLLLSSLIKDKVVVSNNTNLPEYHFLEQSGFFVKKSIKISTAFNLKGHNSFQQYLFDPRFTCCTPLFLKYNGNDLLPTIPLSIPTYYHGEDDSLLKKAGKKIKEAFLEFHRWGFLQHCNPMYAGFMPYMEGKNNWYIPLNVAQSKVFRSNDFLIARVSGKFISVKRKGFSSLFLFVNDVMKRFTNASTQRLREAMIGVSDIYFERTFVIEDTFIHFHDKIWGRIQGNIIFNIRTYANGSSELKNNQFQFEKKGCGFVLLLENGEILKEHNTLCSSKGKVNYWNLINKDGYCQTSKSVVIMNHTLIPFDIKNTLEESIAIFKSLSQKINSIYSGN